jgi:hypothetical protein
MAANSRITAMPGRGRPFQKGQSGNPSARPKQDQRVMRTIKKLKDEDGEGDDERTRPYLSEEA